MTLQKVMFIGQAMPRVKRNPHDWPTLNKWLYSLNFTDEQIQKYFFYSALLNYFPRAKNGSHMVPTEIEIARERPRLQTEMLNFKPTIIVTVGKLSTKLCLGENVKLLSEIIGKQFNVDPYGLLGAKVAVIPLPHPSGASTWRHTPENRRLLLNALKLLKKAVNRAYVFS